MSVAVGDRVRLGRNDTRGEGRVLLIEDGWAWVQWFAAPVNAERWHVDALRNVRAAGAAPSEPPTRETP